MTNSGVPPPREIPKALRILLLSIFCLGALSKGPCPLSNPDFENSRGADGMFSFAGEQATVFQYYSRTSMPRNGSDCYNACMNWPSARARIPNPNPMMPKFCAYWKWVSGDGCYLMGCGICTTFDSFYSPKELYRPLKGDRHCSGGPSWKKCTGGVKGDPHYHGGDQSHFDFTGIPGKHYCLISDSRLHVNVYYGGRYGVWGSNPHKPLTWIRKVGIVWDNHTVVMEARPGPEWEYNSGYVSRITIDDEEIRLNSQGEEATSKDGRIQILWESQRTRDGDDDIDVYRLTVGKQMQMVVKVRPEVAHLRTREDGIVHFTLEFPIAVFSDNVHGVLGQTYRPDHKDRLSQHHLEFNDLLQVNMVKGENAEGFVDGTIEQYESSGILKTDCGFSRFRLGEATSLSSDGSLIQEYLGNHEESTSRKMLR